MNMNEIRPLTQQDVLEALDLLRPWATRRTPKVRVGNDESKLGPRPTRRDDEFGQANVK